jgi:hypothetical protein
MEITGRGFGYEIVQATALHAVFVLMGCGWQAAERGRTSAEEELRKERAARKQQDEKIRDLEQRVRSLQTQTPSAMSGSPDKRKLDLLEKQVTQLKQDKQREEMRRLEAENSLKLVERRANELHSQVRSNLFRGRVVSAHLFYFCKFGRSGLFLGLWLFL